MPLRIFKPALLAALAAFAAAVPAAHGQATLIRNVHDAASDTHVEVLALFSEPAPGGYLPVRVTIANNQQREHRVVLSSDAEDAYSGGSRCSARFSIAAPAGRVVTRDLLVPTLPGLKGHRMGQTLEIRISGSMGSGAHRFYSTGSAHQPRVLLATRLHTANASELDAAATSTFGSRHGGSVTLTARFDPKQLPAEWLAYGAYDRMILTDEDWLDVPAGQRNAILAWVRLGAALEIHHLMDRFDAAALGLPDDAGFGLIEGHKLPATLKLDASASMARMAAAGNRGDWLSSQFDGRWALQSAFGAIDFRYGLFISVLVVFGIVVGPVNLFLLAPAGRRHRLFVTTPLISLGASLLMMGLIIVQDGFGGYGERLVLMEVRPDDGQNAAFIHQEQIVRTGILTSTAFTVATPVLLNPVPMAESRWARFTNNYQSAGLHNLQPAGAALNASGDWFQSRSEQGMAISAVVPSRGRIERAADGGYVSTFAHPLDRLILRDEAGDWHIAENITTGTRFTTKPLDAAAARAALRERPTALLTPRLANFFERVGERPGHFVATSASAPAIETHPGVRWQRTRTIITGPLAP